MRSIIVGALALLLLGACGGDGSNSREATERPDVGDGSEAPSSTTAAAAASTASPPEQAPDTGHEPLGVPSGRTFTAMASPFEANPGARAMYGLLGSAAYRIEMPASWNGDLVLYAHGYRGESSALTVSNPPKALREALIEAGFAWAASSYSENGYVPGLGADDTLALKTFFEAQFGVPGRTYLVGESMGGNVVSLSLEQLDGEYDGALAICGALGGQEQIDYLAAWALAGEYASGIRIPIGEAGRLNTSVLLSLSGALGTPDAPTESGRRFISIIRELTGGERPFFLEASRSSTSRTSPFSSSTRRVRRPSLRPRQTNSWITASMMASG